MKKALLAIAVLSFLPTVSFARKTTYIATDHRFNLVKLEEISLKEAMKREMTHPADIDEEKMRQLLTSLRLQKGKVFGKGIDEKREVFSEPAVDFLAVNLTKAFREATASDEVVFSYLVKDPYFIIRDDRLNVGRAWVSDKKFHIVFTKLWAKVTGDTDKRGMEQKAAAKARSLHVSLEAGPGISFGRSTDELVIDLAYDPSVDAAASDEGAADKAPAEKPKKVKSAGSAEELAPSIAPTVKERLQELETLKREGLISKKEYEEKRKEILKDL